MLTFIHMRVAVRINDKDKCIHTYNLTDHGKMSISKKLLIEVNANTDIAIHAMQQFAFLAIHT